MGGGISSQKDLLQQIHFLSYQKMKEFGSTPRFPDQKQLTITLGDLVKEPTYQESFVIYVSHVWHRGSKDKKKRGEKVHPDTPNNDKYKLMIEGIDKLLQTATNKSFVNCYLWLDYSCLDQNDTPSEQLKQPYYFSMILSHCDVVFTPVVDPLHATWDSLSLEPQPTLTSFYKSPAWIKLDVSNQKESNPAIVVTQTNQENVQPNTTDKSQKNPSESNKTESHKSATITQPAGPREATVNEVAPIKSYLSRAWCRLELFASLLLSFADYPISSKRQEKFVGIFLEYRRLKRRPHYVYGTKESVSNRPPVLLPWHKDYNQLLESSILKSVHPFEGEVSLERDKKIIQSIWAEILKTIELLQQQQKIGDEKTPTKTDVQKTPGETKPSTKQTVKPSQPPAATTIPSQITTTALPTSDLPVQPIILTSAEAVEDGKGRYYHTNGDYYEGEIRYRLPHGFGSYHSHLGGRYEGSFHNGLFHGRGAYTYPNGSVYTGDFLNGLMHGHGKYTNRLDGTIYEGQYENNQKQGTGKLLYSNGDSYEGRFERDEKVGVGLYYEKSHGYIYRQTWSHPVESSSSDNKENNNTKQERVFVSQLLEEVCLNGIMSNNSSNNKSSSNTYLGERSMMFIDRLLDDHDVIYILQPTTK